MSIRDSGIMPRPKSLRVKKCKSFVMRQGILAEYSPAAETGARLFASRAAAAGTAVSFCKKANAKNAQVVFEKCPGYRDEGYEINVSSRQVLVKASSPAGFFYAAITLGQLIDGCGEGRVAEIPAVCIKDEPALVWRGLMLDCGRHYFSTGEIKKILDAMAEIKLNVFHWHLTEDQAWRLEIRKYPELTRDAGWRDRTGFGLPDGTVPHYKEGKYGGVYSREDACEIVRYAAERFITVVPEIELPGHSSAALSVYNWLGCTGGPYELKYDAGIFNDVYCAGNEQVFGFLQDILDEVMEIFPSKYIHIGGDECPKDSWKKCPKCQQRVWQENLAGEQELQSWFVRRIERYLNSKGRTLVGWDEILEGGLSPNATVMSWRGSAGGIAAANLGHDVIMSPTTNCYLDYAQSNHPDEPGYETRGLLTLEQTYALEAVPAEIKPQLRKHVIGAQCNMWTEGVQEDGHLEFMIFPRLCALAEAAWTPKRSRSWANFAGRLPYAIKRLELQGINCRRLDYGQRLGGSQAPDGWRQ